MVGTVAEPVITGPGCGWMRMELKPGAKGRTPKNRRGMTCAGDAAHLHKRMIQSATQVIEDHNAYEWDQVRFGFSSGVHASIVVVAPC
jgi:hypothetical protein